MQNFKPTIASGSWREREHERSRLRKENERIAANDARIKQFAPTDMNFPTIAGVSNNVASTFVSGSDFANKAREWKEKEDAAKLLEDEKKAKLAREEAERKSMFVFRRKQHYMNDAPEVFEEEDSTSQLNSDEWTTVNKKVSRPKKTNMSEREIIEKIDESYAEDYERGGSEEEYNPAQSYGTRDYY